ncbi:hypothetical protein [Rhodococcus erythropolis]|uniref:hypothetical protein n=1 Tax=Rhodococcus erythropolis TaxID=1833 RepID=UPI0036DF4A31
MTSTEAVTSLFGTHTRATGIGLALLWLVSVHEPRDRFHHQIDWKERHTCVLFLSIDNSTGSIESGKDMKDDYRKDISQGPTGRWGWTRWWSKVERSKVVPGGEKTILMIDLLIQGLWLWLRPALEALVSAGPDSVVIVALALVGAGFSFFAAWAVFALLMLVRWLIRKYWPAQQQRL